MFDWLENELATAEKKGEFVHLIDHIPIGNNHQSRQCVLRYKVLLERYQNIITAYISGHSHSDEMRFIREYYTNKYFFVNYCVSSLSARSYNNPSIRKARAAVRSAPDEQWK